MLVLETPYIPTNTPIEAEFTAAGEWRNAVGHARPCSTMEVVWLNPE